MAKKLDEIDLAILDALQRNARLTNLELAQRVQLSPPGLQKRLRKLEQAGLIDAYVALLNREAVGFELMCFIQVILSRHDRNVVQRFKQTIANIPEIQECYHITGETDYLLKVVVRNRRHLERFLVDILTPVPGVDKLRTSVVLDDVKSTTHIPIKSLS